MQQKLSPKKSDTKVCWKSSLLFQQEKHLHSWWIFHFAMLVFGKWYGLTTALRQKKHRNPKPRFGHVTPAAFTAAPAEVLRVPVLKALKTWSFDGLWNLPVAQSKSDWNKKNRRWDMVRWSRDMEWTWDEWEFLLFFIDYSDHAWNGRLKLMTLLDLR